jgi:hypothetical protein
VIGALSSDALCGPTRCGFGLLQSFFCTLVAQDCFADALPNGVFDRGIVRVFWRDQGRFFGFFEQTPAASRQRTVGGRSSGIL